MIRKKVRAWLARLAATIVVEKHRDGYVAYPLNVPGVIVGEGNTYDEALADVKSALKFHIKTFGR